MNSKKIRTSQLIAAILLLIATAVFECTNLDLVIQDHFFNFNTGTWIIADNDQLLRSVFYSGSKKLIVALGVLSILFLGISFKRNYFQARRKGLIIFISALILVPLLVARAKQVTNMYCPYQIQRYDGVYPYVKLFESYPKGFQPRRAGKCFPAGHASGGFAMMALFFMFKKRRYKIAGLCTGLTMGWIMGLYQMLRGAHYLSHTVVTMLLGWIIICLIHQAVTHLENKKHFAWIKGPSTRPTCEDDHLNLLPT